MNDHFEKAILQITKAKSFSNREVIQSLWSGYGQILRLQLVGAQADSVVVKHIRLTQVENHPRGWNTSISHQRKTKSYQVENSFYKKFASNSKVRLPACLGQRSYQNEQLIVLEDLDQSGFDQRKSNVSWQHIELCLQWLAGFHASYINVKPFDLWPIGTYWHLSTRPDELKVLEDLELKHKAHVIDELLNACRYKTILHGDAKLANFCFSKNAVAGVDFQYVGGGCGMKDVVYFISSCLGEKEIEQYEVKLLDTYFKHLRIFLQDTSIDFLALETEWRGLFKIAWVDFYRFLKGWSPNHWKINSYSDRIIKQVLKDLN